MRNRKKGGKRKDRRGGVKRNKHNIPDSIDLKLLQEDLEKFKSKLDSEGRLTDKAAATMLRSAIRQVWMRAPNKLAFLLERQIPDVDVNTRRRWKFKCEMCEGWFSKSDVEVDHIKGNHSLKSPHDFPSYYDNILNAKPEEMQLACKPCHENKTYAESLGIDIEEAKIVKRAIWIEKENTVAVLKQILTKHHLPHNNVKVRRESLITLVKLDVGY